MSLRGLENFAFGALAYFIARTYYFFNTQHQWPIWTSAALSVLVIAPLTGVFLWAVLFRFLQNATTLVKIVCTIGLSVTIPPVTSILYGNIDISSAPGLAPEPVQSYLIFGVAVTLDQIIVIVSVMAVLVGGACLVRFTNAGSSCVHWLTPQPW